MTTQLLEQAKKLSIDERLELVEALWDSIAEQSAVPEMSAEQRAELDRRLSDHIRTPDDVVPWEEVRASALRDLGK